MKPHAWALLEVPQENFSNFMVICQDCKSRLFIRSVESNSLLAGWLRRTDVLRVVRNQFLGSADCNEEITKRVLAE